MHLPVLLLVAVCAVGAVEMAYGHLGFYSSPKRPLGCWRGDSTCYRSGARIAAIWNAESDKHVLWCVDDPGVRLYWPLVAGEKVFVTADPNLLLCYDVHDGDWTVLNKTHCSGCRQNAGPSVQTNRLFYRTRDTRWCIGDTLQEYPVTKRYPDHARAP